MRGMDACAFSRVASKILDSQVSALISQCRDVVQPDLNQNICSAHDDIKNCAFEEAFESILHVRNKVDGDCDDKSPLNNAISGIHYLSASLDCTLSHLSGFPPVQPSLCVRSIVDMCCEDIGAFSVEKFGVSPKISIVGDATARCVEGYAAFVVSELLKNAIVSTVSAHGPLDADRNPILVSLCQAHGRNRVRISVADAGVGVPSAVGPLMAFGSTTTANVEDPCRNSRNFGVEISGKGVGLGRSLVFCRWHGGSLSGRPRHGGVGAEFVAEI